MILKKTAKAHEAEHAGKHEEKFKTIARRNKLLGLWAAGLLKIEGAEVEEYAKQVVHADFEEPGDEDVLRWVFASLTQNGIEISKAQVREKMEELLKVAENYPPPAP